MRKSILLSFLCLLCVFVTHAGGETWTHKYWSANPKLGTQTLSNKSWTISSNNSSVYLGRNSTTYAVFGSSKQSFTNLTLSSDAFPGAIYEVKVETLFPTAEKLTVEVKVGDKSLGSEEVLTDQETFVFSDSNGAHGDIEIIFSGNSSGKQLRLYSLSVNHDPNLTNPLTPAAPVFKDEDEKPISGNYTIYSKDGGSLLVSCDTEDATLQVTSVPADAIEYEDGLILVFESCTITATATNEHGSSETVINVIVDKSPAPPVFYGTSGTVISDKTYTFTSIINTQVSVTYETDATGSIAFYEPNSTTVIEVAVTDLQTENGKFTFSVVKPCTVEVTATRDGLSTSSSVTFFGPKPADPTFVDSNNSPISGTFVHNTTESGDICKVYAVLGENTSSVSYTASNPSAILKAEETVIDGKQMLAFEVDNATDITVVAGNNFESSQATLKIQLKKYVRFERVTSAQDIRLGGQYVILSATTGSPLSISPVPRTSNGELSGVKDAVTINGDGSATVEVSSVAVFTLEEGTDNFAMRYATGEYLTVPGSNTTSFNSGNDPKSVYADVKITHGTTYDTFNFTKNNKIIRYTNPAFRSYADSNTSNVYLYHIPSEKAEVLLDWSKDEYLLDADFGWDGGKPELTIAAEDEELTAETLGIVYSSSDTSVATINKDGEVSAKGDGECVITASIPSSNYLYKAEPATYTLYVTSANLPVFMDEMDGTAYETNEVALLPSALAAGFTLYVKPDEGYGVNVTISPAGAGKVTSLGDGAYVTVTKDCSITARTKKGDQSSTRYASFRVKTMDLAPADIKWTADRYVYDLANKSWNTTPELVNNYDLPVTYASNNERVATVSPNGKITPLEQGTAIISATVEGTDDYQRNVVTTTIRVTDSTAPAGYDVFEMVKKGDQLRENEQFIIVTGEPINPEVNVGDYAKEGGRYYAVSPYKFMDGTTAKDYYAATAIDFPEGDESGDRLLVSDDAKVLRLSKQYDTSGKDSKFPFLFQVMNDEDEEIQGKYLQVNGAKNFVFVNLPENIEDRGLINGNVRVLDPEDPNLNGYVEEDYIEIKKSSESETNTSYAGTKGTFTDKGEILFSGADGKRYFIRFNPGGKAIHFNIYAEDNTYDATTRSKASTFPVRIYRLAKRVEKPSITVYPEEPVASDIAYQEEVTYNNKVRVVIEQHPKTSAEAQLMRQWQEEGHNPALPDYDSFVDNQIVVYVDGHAVEDAEGNVLRYIDPEFNASTATRTLFAVSQLDGVFSESAEATFNFKTSAPRIAKASTDADGNMNVRIARPTNYTKDAVYYYVISDDNAKPSVTFNIDGTVSAADGTAVEAWTGNSDDTETGIISLPTGKTLWVGAFKAGYEPAVVEYNNHTIFPECRPMQLLRLTDKGREIIFSETSGLDMNEVFEGAYDPTKPLYINYRNDLVNEDGTLADSENHFHYLIQRDHTYGDRYTRNVEIEQISEDLFKKVFGENYINVDEEHARNFLWTSDYYVFVANLDEFSSALNEKVDINEVTLVTPDRTYKALENFFNLRPTNSDGTYVAGSTAERVIYYGVMLENEGKLGAKTVTSVVNYTVGDGANAKEYTTETSAETSPRIPSSFGFTFEYEYEREEESQLAANNPGAQFVKLSVPSAIGKGNSEALIPIDQLNNRHLNLIFKFNRPNISKHILQHYDIYYTIKFNRHDETDPANPVHTLLSGSGVYVDNEIDEEKDDAVYRFRIDDVNPTAAVYPEIEISKVTYVGNANSESYGQYVSNFGQQKTVAPAPNNSEKKPLSIKELWIAKAPNREVDGKAVADWMYISHIELEDTPDIIVNNPHTGNKIDISSMFYHIETYIPGTEYYSAYEYLIKHDDEAHFTPEDESHPFYTDEVLGNESGMSYDAMRYTIIARDFPCNEDDSAITPKVVISPVYFFSYGADMNPVQIDKDDKVIDSFSETGGYAKIDFVNDLPGTVSPKAARRNAPRRAASTGTEAPSTREYPMPHAGDTNMNHESILDLTADPDYNVVIGGHYEPDDDSPIMTGIENLVKDGASEGEAVYYNLQGVRVANPGHGFFIRVIGGQAVKVLR